MILKEEALAPEALSLSIADQVDATLNANGSQIIIHLINLSGARKQIFGSHIPISGGKIKVPAGSKVQLLVRDQELEVHNGEVALPELDLYEVVVVDQS